MTNTPIEFVLSNLPSARSTGENQWLAKCPAHSDDKASLCIGLGDDGKALVRCQAGCSVEVVCKALGIGLRDLFPTSSKPARRRIVATYNYRAENGNLLYQTVRYEPKDFRQRRPDGKGGRVWNLNGVRRVLYSLPALVKADPSKLIFVVEGEADADTLIERGVLATTCSMGAGKWSKVDSSPLNGRLVAVLGDNDDAGQRHQRDVANHLHGKAKEVKVIELPGLGAKQDVSDWLGNGHKLAELISLVWDTPVYKPDPTQGPTKDDDTDASDDRKPPESSRRSQSSELVDLCDKSGVELFHEPGIGGDAFATIVVGRHRETYRLRSREFRRWLGRQFWMACRQAPSSQATQNALAVLGGKAHFECPEHRVDLRLASHDSAIYLDLGNESWEAVEITPDGWRIVAEPPVRFRRTRGMRALPYPSTGRDIAALRPFLNLGSNDAWVLVVAFLLGTLKPSGPFPILVVVGEQGSCKSSLCRVLRSLVDPNVSDLRATPRDERDLVISANNGWLVVFDNLSHIRTWLSDAMCRLVTGGGFSTRELFTDQDEIILDVQRPVILNGIEELATRGDLLDRSICVTLPTIGKGQRKTESEFWAAFERARPRILGGLLDAVSTALQNVASTQLRELPRMADFATWIVAAESALPFKAGAFMAAYNTNLTSSDASVIEASATGPAIVQLVTTQGHWQETASELLTALSSNSYTEEKDRKRRDWPDNPRAMSNAVRRLAPTLRAGGIDVDFDRESKSGRRLIILENRCNSSSVSSVASPSAFSGQKPGLWGDDRGDDTDATTNRLRHPENGDSSQETATPDGGDATDARIRDSSAGHASDDGNREVFVV